MRKTTGRMGSDAGGILKDEVIRLLSMVCACWMEKVWS